MKIIKSLWVGALCQCCEVRPQEYLISYDEPIQLELFQEMKVCTKVCFSCYNQALIAEAMKGQLIDIFA